MVHVEYIQANTATPSTQLYCMRKCTYDLVFPKSSLCIILTEVVCPEPRSQPNVTLLITGYTMGSVATLTCADSHRFMNGESVAEIQCSQFGTWSTLESSCEGITPL